MCCIFFRNPLIIWRNGLHWRYRDSQSVKKWPSSGDMVRDYKCPLLRFRASHHEERKRVSANGIPNQPFHEFLPKDQVDIFKCREKGIESPELTSLMKPLILSYNELFGDLNNAIRNKFVGYFAELRTYCFALSKIFLTLSLLEHYLMTFSSKDL